MTPAEVRETVEAVIDTAVTDDTRIAWPNVAFTPPATGPWVKIDFLWGNGAVTTKTGMNMINGVLQVAIFDRRYTGDGPLEAQADAVRSLFNRQRMGDLWFGAASGPVRLDEEGWRQMVVSVPFRMIESL